MYDEIFDHVRDVSKEQGCFSWTSRDYQDDILRWLIEHRDQGVGVIEVGCYKGGLTALLASLCKEFDWLLWTIDIDETAVASTRSLLSTLELIENVNIHHGTLASFVPTVELIERPALIILDGDHRYEAVVEDINNVYRLNRLPYAAAFHDYSLRHPSSGEKVDQAVKDTLGNCTIRHIGARMDGSGPYPTKNKPSDDGHWWEVPGSEGAIAELPERPIFMTKPSQAPMTDRSSHSILSRIVRRLLGR